MDRQHGIKVIDELPEKFLEKNSFFDGKEEVDDFEFNQDLDSDEDYEVLVG